ncbi:MAG TPA: LacI family DNA-binding transcriptional regulator [Abditibacteriaceae bacterium]|jgi:LacI family repressor for deo operon, udp, cdd, tsx, nupC, and nupG
MKRNPSSQDVAERAGVSRTTVSYVLSGRAHTSIPQETQARVRQAARELRYRSNRLANGILRGQTKMLGVVLPHLAHSFYSLLLQGIHEECDRHGYSVLLAHSRNDLKVEQQRVGLLMEYRVDALLCVNYARYQSEAIAWAQETREAGLPCVLLDCLPAGHQLDGVISDDVNGARVAIEHLIALGHHRIGHVMGDQRINTGKDRYRSYLQALQNANIQVDDELIIGGEFLFEDGQRAMNTLLDLDHPPSAVFAANDTMAEGALEALQARGLQAPQDVALVGYGNLEASRGFGLTSVDQNPLLMGQRAVQCALARLNDETLAPQQIVVPTQLVVRRTCGASIKAAGEGQVSATNTKRRRVKRSQ